MKMLNILLITYLIPFLSSCGGGPQPIRFGEDACDNCRMIISDPRFGAQLVTDKGKAFKFDDISCYWKYKKNQKLTDTDIAHSLVVDYHHPKTMIDANNACILRAESIKSPMSSKLAAIGQDKACAKLQKKWQASRYSWAETAALID